MARQQVRPTEEQANRILELKKQKDYLEEDLEAAGVSYEWDLNGLMRDWKIITEILALPEWFKLWEDSFL